MSVAVRAGVGLVVRPMRIAVAMLVAVLATSASAASLVPLQSIALPAVEGRIDHMSVDAKTGRLFVAALGNNSVEVIDVKAGRPIRSLGGFSEPQGVLFVPEFGRLFVANAGDGSVRVLDGTSFAEVGRVKFDDDADNLRYDAREKQIYVGYGSGALGIIDGASNAVVGTVAFDAHPESFQLEQTGSRVFVNLPGAHTVAVVDRTSQRVVGSWSLGLVAANFPMALDEANHRAFIGCRAPARLLVFDTQTDHQIAKLDLHGDCDDLLYDDERHQVYASCGEGYIDVFEAKGDGTYTRREAVKTRPRARTCYLSDDKLYLAAPKTSGSPATIEVYELAK